MHAAAARDQSHTRFRQSEYRVLGGDDDVAGERGFEPAAHRHAIHRRDQRLVDIETMREPGESVRSGPPPFTRGPNPEVLAGGESPWARRRRAAAPQTLPPP